MQSGGVQEWRKRSQPAHSCTFHGLGWRLVTSVRALFCRRRRRASGAFEGLPALKPVFYSPYACAVRKLGPQKRNERKRAGNLGCDFASPTG